MIEKGIKSVREAGMLEQIYCVRTKDSPNNYNSLEDPENIQPSNPSGMCGDRGTILGDLPYSPGK